MRVLRVDMRVKILLPAFFLLAALGGWVAGRTYDIAGIAGIVCRGEGAEGVLGGGGCEASRFLGVCSDGI